MRLREQKAPSVSTSYEITEDGSTYVQLRCVCGTPLNTGNKEQGYSAPLSIVVIMRHITSE